MTHTAHRANVARVVEVDSGHTGGQIGRLIATLIGAAALIVGAFTPWTRGVTADNLTNRALFQTNFAVQTDLVRTAGGISVLIGILALVGLADRTGWITRLAGALGVILFILFAIEVFRAAGHSFSTAWNDVQPGAWLPLAGGIVLLIGGLFGSRPLVEVPTVIEEDDPAARGYTAEQPRYAAPTPERPARTEAEAETAEAHYEER
jgi:hypothetical protein